MLWGIWCLRNDIVFSGAKVSLSDLVWDIKLKVCKWFVSGFEVVMLIIPSVTFMSFAKLRCIISINFSWSEMFPFAECYSCIVCKRV